MAGKLKIKYCIWDVGGVIYPYTLKFVNEFMKSRTEDMAAFNENNGAVGFDYDAFMLGKVSFETLCRQLCKYCAVKFQPGIDAQINLAFRDGIGEFRETTRRPSSFELTWPFTSTMETALISSPSNFTGWNSNDNLISLFLLPLASKSENFIIIILTLDYISSY